MLRIIFAGSEFSGNFAKEVAQAQKWKLSFVNKANHIDEQLNAISLAAMKGCDFIIYDTRDYIDDPEVIAERIEKVKKANGAEPIVLADTGNTKNVIIRACLARGIKLYINAGAATTSDLKDQLIKNVTGLYAGGREDIKKIEEQIEKEKIKANSFKTIGIAGSQRRIGTTTQAIQMAKYIQSIGYRVALVELNDNRYENRQLTRKEKQQLSFFEKTRLMFEPEIDEPERGYIRYQGVDAYYKQELLTDILDAGYDFYVYDYGVYKSGGFNKTAFLRDDMQFFAVGANTAEIDFAYEIATDISYQKASLIFSFTLEADRDEIKDLFTDIDAGDRCYFTEYTPNPYLLTDFELYEKLLNMEENESAQPIGLRNKKKGFFGRKKHG